MCQRLGVLFRVVAMVVQFDAGTKCDLQKDLVIAPLPAKKQLWEASNEFVWQAENESDPGAQNAFALAATGELLRLDEDQQFSGSDALLLRKPVGIRTPSRSAANWEEWCAGMDSLGALVMLAASLVA